MSHYSEFYEADAERSREMDAKAEKANRKIKEKVDAQKRRNKRKQVRHDKRQLDSDT